jgi:hypothetical protein
MLEYAGGDSDVNTYVNTYRLTVQVLWWLRACGRTNIDPVIRDLVLARWVPERPESRTV